MTRAIRTRCLSRSGPHTTATRPLRIAVLASPPGGATDPRVADRVRAAADALADAGYEVTEDGPPRFEDAVRTWFDFIGEDIRFMSPMITPIMGESANAFLGAVLESLPAHDLAGYTQILMARQALMREWAIVVRQHRSRAHADVDADFRSSTGGMRRTHSPPSR